jgi:ubiquinone/menaquinone biosynthesis C-methylase UbiE
MPKPDHALDLGAGTGLSTRAMLGFAETVVGIDTSEEMLQRRSESRGYYVLAAAELLPFRDDVFDLATIASALHWFGPDALGEVVRVLRPGGSLVVYDVWFPAEMRGVAAFHQWATGEGLSRYVSVPRHAHDRETLQAARRVLGHLCDTTLDFENESFAWMKNEVERLVRDGSNDVRKAALAVLPKLGESVGS